MDRIFEMRVDSLSSIRQVVAMLQYELQIANKQGREICIEIWKERQDQGGGDDNLSQLHEELAREVNHS